MGLLTHLKNNYTIKVQQITICQTMGYGKNWTARRTVPYAFGKNWTAPRTVPLAVKRKGDINEQL